MTKRFDLENNIPMFFFQPNLSLGKQTLNLNGKRLGINKEDLMTIAKDNNIKKGEKIIEQLNSTIKSWNKYASRAQLKNELKEKINHNLNTF